VSGKPVRIELMAIPPDAKFVASTVYDLAPNQFLQIPFKAFGLDATYNTRVTVKVIGGTGRINRVRLGHRHGDQRSDVVPRAVAAVVILTLLAIP